MSAVSGLAGVSGLGSASSPQIKKDEMGQEDFLKLLVAQMKNQDPTKPMDNFQFLSQIAQFGMVDGIQNLETSFGSVADSMRQNQLVEASSLLGRKVIAESGDARLTNGGLIEGQVAVPAGARDVVVEVRSSQGTVVYSSTVPTGAQGELPFAWNGTNYDGGIMPAGQYKVSARGLVDGQMTELEVSTLQQVESITVAASGAVELSLANGEVMPLTNIKQFK